MFLCFGLPKGSPKFILIDEDFHLQDIIIFFQKW